MDVTTALAVASSAVVMLSWLIMPSSARVAKAKTGTEAKPATAPRSAREAVAV